MDFRSMFSNFARDPPGSCGFPEGRKFEEWRNTAEALVLSRRKQGFDSPRGRHLPSKWLIFHKSQFLWIFDHPMGTKDGYKDGRNE